MFLVLSSLFSIVPFRLFLLCVSSPWSLVCSQSCLFTSVQFVCLCPCLCLRVKASCFILLVSRLMCTMFSFPCLISLIWVILCHVSSQVCSNCLSSPQLASLVYLKPQNRGLCLCSLLCPPSQLCPLCSAFLYGLIG